MHVKGKDTKLALQGVLMAFLLVFAFSVPALADAENKVVAEGEGEPKPPAIDRWAFKTNAFEWILTIPNFGVEFDIVNSEFKQWASQPSTTGTLFTGMLRLQSLIFWM